MVGQGLAKAPDLSFTETHTKPHASRCHTCGHGGDDWQIWSNRQRYPFKIIVHAPDRKPIEMTGQRAKVLTMLQLAARQGVSKRQLSGWHVGHWAQMLREDLGETAISTEMIKATFPKGSRPYGVYRLEMDLRIEHVPNDEGAS